MADYHQFYVWDPSAAGEMVLENWSQEDVDDRVKIAKGVVVICPVRNDYVPVEVTVWPSESQIHFNAWQHVVEAPLESSGSLDIDECTGEKKASLTVEPGDYTVRAMFRGLDTLSEDGFEGKDFYEVQIWKSPCPAMRVIRRWP